MDHAQYMAYLKDPGTLVIRDELPGDRFKDRVINTLTCQELITAIWELKIVKFDLSGAFHHAIEKTLLENQLGMFLAFKRSFEENTQLKEQVKQLMEQVKQVNERLMKLEAEFNNKNEQIGVLDSKKFEFLSIILEEVVRRTLRSIKSSFKKGESGFFTIDLLYFSSGIGQINGTRFKFSVRKLNY